MGWEECGGSMKGRMVGVCVEAVGLGVLCCTYCT